jgi:hypothetical protein
LVADAPWTLFYLLLLPLLLLGLFGMRERERENEREVGRKKVRAEKEDAGECQRVKERMRKREWVVCA